MNLEALATQLKQGLQDLNIQAKDQQIQQLLDYLTLLNKWNQAYNLTAIRQPEEMVTLHLLDSLALLPYVSEEALIDVGSGAGLPGIPLAIMKPKLPILSLDSNGKKTRFQFQVKTALALECFQVVQARTEQHQPSRLSHQLVSRAFASLKDFVTLTEHLAAPNARWLAMKGQFPEAELEELPAGFVLTGSHALQVPGIEAQRHLLIIQRQANP